MKSLRHLNKYFFKYRWILLLGVVFVAAQNFGSIYPAQVVRKAIDDVLTSLQDIRQHPSAGEKSLVMKEITRIVFLYFLLIMGVAFLKGILMFLMRQTIIVVSRRIEFDLKNEIFQHYQKLSLAFYRRNNTGDLMNRISEDVSRVRMYLGPVVMYSINLLVLFLLIIPIMLSVNIRMSLLVLAPLPLLSLSIYYVSDIMNRKSERVQEQQSRLSTFVQEAFSGIRILKSFAREEMAVSEFQSASVEYRHRNMELARVNAFFFPLMLLLVGLSTLLTVYIGGQEVLAGRATTGNIAEFIMYVNLLTWPVASLGWVTSLAQRAAASQQRINEFLETLPEIRGNNEILEKPIHGKIEFRNVTFVYPDSGITALRHVSFTVEPGRSLAVLGKTGSGKSTIANLILRMYDTTSGEVRVDDVSLKDIPVNSFRKQVGYVPQDVFLFSDTIANNIAFGLDDTHTSAEKHLLVHQAARDSVIYDNIMAFPRGFDTILGERGITLSGGQKQRVSIARAIIRKPRILLFDDCLSAVDTKTEAKILFNLNNIMQGRTSVIISHRVSTVKNADAIIVLDEGIIVERGNHATLMKKKGAYYELYEKQLLEEKEEEAD
ncbi:MAG: ABC transporter ATP-binding protein [Bacteroidia bacterium]|nr:ABC transporter ATP-binding protein [Bacteroidia bacterium]